MTAEVVYETVCRQSGADKGKRTNAGLCPGLASHTSQPARVTDSRTANQIGEFQKIIDHRGQAPLSVLYPLAHLGLSRAASLMGDSAQSQKAYKAFWAMWKAARP